MNEYRSRVALEEELLKESEEKIQQQTEALKTLQERMQQLEQEKADGDFAKNFIHDMMKVGSIEQTQSGELMITRGPNTIANASEMMQDAVKI